jgi:hypothetical protein
LAERISLYLEKKRIEIKFRYRKKNGRGKYEYRRFMGIETTKIRLRLFALQ